MIFRALTETGDWIFGCGRASYLTEQKAINANIETKLKTFLSECFFDKNAGVPWFNLIDSKNKDVIVLAVKSAISECDGVLNVSELEYTFNDNRELEIKYAIATIYESYSLGTVTI